MADELMSLRDICECEVSYWNNELSSTQLDKLSETAAAAHTLKQRVSELELICAEHCSKLSSTSNG